MENTEDEWNTKLDAAKGKKKNNKMHIRAAGIKHEDKKKEKMENN